MKEQIAQYARELGFDGCRFATAERPASACFFEQWLAEGCHGGMAYLERNARKRVDPEQVLAGARSIVVLATSYFGNGIGSGGDRPVNVAAAEDGRAPGRGIVARYARFKDYHDVLAERLRALTKHIDELGGPGTRSLWYVDTGPVLERDVAQRAGVGFIGKHTNLVSRKLGNWIFLSEILTTLNIAPDEPERNRCGSCVRCIEACPTGAIRAPFKLDARLCISYLTIELKGPIPTELRPAVGNRIYGCDDCLEACPWNRFARAGQLMQRHARADLGTPSLLELLALDEAGFKQRFAGTPMLRTKRRGLLRNVCVALGNVGDRTALEPLEIAAKDPEPLIAEHARWAIERIRERHFADDESYSELTINERGC